MSCQGLGGTAPKMNLGRVDIVTFSFSFPGTYSRGGFFPPSFPQLFIELQALFYIVRIQQAMKQNRQKCLLSGS